MCYSFVTPQIIARQAPLSMGFLRPEYWTRLPSPSPGDLLNPGIEPLSPALAGWFFTTESPGKPNFLVSDVSVSVLITLSICYHLCVHMGMYIYNLFIKSSYSLFYLYLFSVYLLCLLQRVFYYYWSVLFLLFLPSYSSMVGRRTIKILGKFWPGKFSLRRCPLSKGLKEGREGVVRNLEWEHHRQRLLQRQKAWSFKGDQECETEWVRGGEAEDRVRAENWGEGGWAGRGWMGHQAELYF